MKKVGVLLALLGVAALVCAVAYVGIGEATSSAAIQMSPEHIMFNEFKFHNRKFYFNDEEHNFRFAVWQAARAKIMERNANPERTFDMAINMFADLTTEEFLAHYTGANPDLMPLDDEARTVYFDGVVALDSDIDWTKKGAVTGVKNQGQCGSCWAFSSTGALESAYYLKHNSLESFSEQQLVDCTYGQGNYGCNGGMPYNSFHYLKSHKEEAESSYAYTAKDGSCKYDANKGITGDSNYYHVSASDSQIRQALSGRPLSVCLDATPLQYYSGGIVDASSCSTRINHAVLMTGYKSSDSAWKIKNSWGTGWGESGYFRLKDGGNTCGIQSYVYYPVI